MSEKPIPIGTVRTVDMETGEVTDERPANWTMLPPAPDKCQVCAGPHAPGEPHNQQSLFYQMRFYGENGRWPTWTDAMAHCDEATRKVWREELVKLMRTNGLELPADLQD